MTTRWSTLRFYLSRPRRFPWRFALWYAKQRLRQRLRPDRPPKGPKFATPQVPDAAHFRERKRPAFFPGAARVTCTAGESLTAWKPELIENGRRALSHAFDFGGFGPVDLGPEIDWKVDPYGPTLNDDLRRRHPDLRIVWELNRCSHLPVLSLAYSVSGDAKYAVELDSQIRHWGRSNPPWNGPNWASSMEASIRIINWIWAFYLVRATAQCDDRCVTEFLTQINAHGLYIHRNLERSAASNNHYLAGGIGLLHLGVLFPEIKDAKRWLRAGKRIVFSEVLNQTSADGAGYEGSIPYHGLVLELVLPTVILCQQNDIDVPTPVLRRIERMLEFVLAYSRSDGSFPQFGDRDDGHLLRIVRRAEDSHRHLLAVGAVIFQRADFKAGSDGWDLEAELLLGGQGRALFDDLPVSPQAQASKAFPDGGYFFMRSQQAHMAIDCADVGLNGRGGHGHNDCLSFELYAYDQTLLVDSGTMQYAVPEETRRMFQSTASHNTATVDDEEISRFVPGNSFRIYDDARPRMHFWHSDDNYDIFEGSHGGYRRLDDSVTHTRRIIFDKRSLCWVIDDSFSGAKEHSFKVHFHLAPEYLGFVKVLEFGAGVYSTDPDGPNLALLILLPSDVDIEIRESSVSRRYGHSAPAPVVCIAATAKAPWSLRTCLCPFMPSAQRFLEDELRRDAIAAVDYWENSCTLKSGESPRNDR